MRIKYKKFSNGKYFWMMIARKISHFLAFNLVQYLKKKTRKKTIRQDFVPEYHKSFNTLSVKFVFLSCMRCCLNASMKCSEDCIKKMTNTPNAGGEETH